jgi:hypothetical protein
MKPERFKRTKSVMASGAIALVVAALAFGVSSSVLGPKSASSPRQVGFSLTASSCPANPLVPPNFSVCGPAVGHGPVLDPGAPPSTLPLTFYNPLSVSISVYSLTVAFTNSFPTNCASSALRVNGNGVSGSPPSVTLSFPSGSYINVPGGSVSTPGTMPYNATLALADSGNQNACQSLALTMSYTAQAQYIDGTTTTLTSTPNPSTSGQSVTFTANVTADNASADTSQPSGLVSFYQCTSATVCPNGSSNLLGTGTIGTGGKASYSTSTLPVGTTNVDAVFPASGTNFYSSTSTVVTQMVSSSTLGTTSVLTSSPNPSTAGQSVGFTDTVASTTTGTPGGTVTFYNCGTSSTCSGTPTSLGTETLSGGKATYSTSSLPVGTTYVEAVYGASGNYGGSTSNVVTQVVNALSTTSVLTSSPNPSSYGTSVTFSDTVSAASGTPGGSVTFYSCTSNTCLTKTSLGTETLASGKATYSTSSLPVGTTYVEAVYGASGNYGGSTSNVVTQAVLNVPSVCGAGGYSDVITGTPADQFLYGTNGNDLIYAFGASYWIDAYAGNDCIDAGDGNNVIFDGNGNDGVAAGNGSNAVILGNGSDKVSLGNGSDGVNIGDGNDTVTVGNGSDSGITVGNGSDRVTIGTGSSNDVELGSGTDTVTIQGSHDDIDGGAGNETIYLGSGTYNTYSGQAHHTNVCHLPTPPSSYHGTAASYYDDTITNCTVVSP